jgi:hypothetical protein
MKNKKGQLGVGDAPTIVLIVGFVFLIMATMAYIGEKYGDAVDTDNTAGAVTNETVTTLNTSVGDYLARATLKNVVCSSTAIVTNSTGGQTVPSTNYTLSSSCLLTGKVNSGYIDRNVNISYTYTYSALTASSNVTDDMQTEISNNTSIAGIVLTISLVGIVLAVLIGIFLAARKGGM